MPPGTRSNAMLAARAEEKCENASVPAGPFAFSRFLCAPARVGSVLRVSDMPPVPKGQWFDELARFLGPAYLRNAFTFGAALG
jgi:hypothetical protein